MILFRIRSQVNQSSHRTNASTKKVRGRRSRSPGVEALEGRPLMATIQFMGAGANFTDVLNTTAQPANITISNLNNYQSQTLGSVYDSLAIIGVNTPTDFAGPIFHHTLRIFYGNYSANPKNPYPSTATASLTGGQAKIMPGPGESVGDPVYVKVAACFTDEDGVESSNGTSRRSGGSYSGSFSVLGGNGQAFSFSPSLGPNDITTSDSKILLFHVGDTINITFNGTGSSPGTTADLATEFDADIQIVKEADISPTTPTWRRNGWRGRLRLYNQWLQTCRTHKYRLLLGQRYERRHHPESSGKPDPDSDRPGHLLGPFGPFGNLSTPGRRQVLVSRRRSESPGRDWRPRRFLGLRPRGDDHLQV